MKKTATIAESIHAMWHDPSTYDHMKMGPPYLPGQTIEPQPESRPLFAKSANGDVQAGACSELAALLVVLRALSFVHQTHHWQTAGATSYGDHLLFDRLYNDTLPLIDSVAERCMGMDGLGLICPIRQSEHVALTIRHLHNGAPSEPNSDDMVAISLKGVETFLEFFKICISGMKARGVLTDGTENLLQGVADKHEEFLYLLKQRGASRIASQKWKAQ